MCFSECFVITYSRRLELGQHVQRHNMKFLHQQPGVEGERAVLRASVATIPEAVKACKPLIKCSFKSSCSLLSRCQRADLSCTELFSSECTKWRGGSNNLAQGRWS